MVIAVVFSYLTVAYIFSGLVCWSFFSRNSNTAFRPFKKQRTSIVLLIPVITFLWPLWIIIEFMKLNILNKETQPAKYLDLDAEAFTLIKKGIASSK